MTNEQTSENADLALKHRLYVSGWMLSSSLIYARENPENYYVNLKYNEQGVPIAVIHMHMSGGVQIFVRKSERRKGHGTSLIKIMMDEFPSIQLRYDNGILGSSMFWANTIIKSEKENDLC